MTELRFEWDRRKEKANEKKHGISFDEARTVFYDENAIQFFDPDHSDDEDRFILLGISFKLLNGPIEKSDIQKAPSYFELIKDRKIQLYLFPWIMFTIINFAEAPMIETVIGPELFPILQLVTWFLVGIFAIIGGYIADIVGRKRVIIAGFVMLGIEYAAMSTFNTEFAGYLFVFLDGVSWGLLLSVFLCLCGVI